MAMAPIDPDTFNSILDRLATGETLLAICSTAGMPSRSAIQDHCANSPQDAARLAGAHARQLAHHLDECLTIADTGDPARARLQVEVRLKRAAILDPSRYGDRSHATVEHVAHRRLVVDTGVRRSPPLPAPSLGTAPLPLPLPAPVERVPSAVTPPPPRVSVQIDGG